MPTYTYTWPDTSTKMGTMNATSGVVNSRDTQADDFAPTAGFDGNVYRGFREVDLASLSIPPSETVVSAVLSRTISYADPGIAYKVVGVSPITISLADTPQDHFDGIGDGADYQNTPDSTESGVVATTLNAAGLSDLQTAVTAEQDTFMLGIVLDDESVTSIVYEDGYAAGQTFVITTTAAPSSAIATLNGVARASVATVNGLAIADVASVNGLA